MRIADIVRDRGPLTVAAFMDLALYDPHLGYYARAARRSGRAGDFFTSVDVGPLFGELLEVQIAEMFEILRGGHIGPPLRTNGVGPAPSETNGVEAAPGETNGVEAAPGETNGVGADPRVGPFDLVEAGAGDGRLAGDILRAARRRDPSLYDALRLHLVEASAAARASHVSTLADVADRLASSSPALPESFEGVLIANELLDAFPVHQVVMRKEGLREVYVAARSAEGHPIAQSPRDGGPVASRSISGDEPGARGFSRAALTPIEEPPSTPALAGYLDRLGVALQPGWRVEINLRAVEWMRDAARRLRRGFIVIIDYGHEARELYSATHAGGTLTTFAGHRSSGPDATPDAPPWLRDPGEHDLTAHVDFTSVRAAAEGEGMATIAFLDQTYFLLGLLSAFPNPQSRLRSPDSRASYGEARRSAFGAEAAAVSNRQLKTLVMPGGLGSTHKVLILSKGVAAPVLQGCSFKVRVT